MATLVLTVIGDDRAGLVEALSAAIANHGGNWEQSQMAELAGKFAGVVVVSVPDDAAAALHAELDQIEHRGLLDITAATASAPAGEPARQWTLELLGADRPGIVHEISRALASHGVSIGDLRTATRDAPMAGGLLFEATVTISAGPDVDLASLRADLEAIASELMVDLTLAEAPPA
jgi:glycine cleavage system regulatory protein